jgi:hypothetical protein
MSSFVWSDDNLRAYLNVCCREGREHRPRGLAHRHDVDSHGALQRCSNVGVAERTLHEHTCVGRRDRGANDVREVFSECGNGSGQLTCFGSVQAESPVTTSNCRSSWLTTFSASPLVQR